MSDQPTAIAVNDSNEIIAFCNNAGTDASMRLTPAPLDATTAILGEWETLSTTMTSGKQSASLAHPTYDEVILIYGSCNPPAARRS